MPPSAKKKRQQVAVSCLACRKSKKQCDQSLPCQRCLRLGIGDECHATTRARGARVGGAPGAPGAQLQLHRPVSYRGRCVVFPPPDRCDKTGPAAPWRKRVLSDPKSAWAIGVISRMVGYGYPGNYYLDNFFTPLPADVNEGLKTAFLSVGIMALVHSRGIDTVRRQAQLPGGGVADQGWDIVDEIYENSSQHAVERMAVDPATGARTRTSFNSSFCQFYQMHPEETSARLLNSEMKMVMSEFEKLQFMGDLAVHGRDFCMTR